MPGCHERARVVDLLPLWLGAGGGQRPHGPGRASPVLSKPQPQDARQGAREHSPGDRHEPKPALKKGRACSRRLADAAVTPALGTLPKAQGTNLACVPERSSGLWLGELRCGRDCSPPRSGMTQTPRPASPSCILGSVRLSTRFPGAPPSSLRASEQVGAGPGVRAEGAEVRGGRGCPVPLLQAPTTGEKAPGL